jgi:CRP/FNR family cyclic AMP-dependent transcriptional regulator
MAATLRFQPTHPHQTPGQPTSAGPEGLVQAALFASLGDAARDALAAACQVRTFKSGQVLFHQGDPGHALYLIQAGRVKIVRLASSGQETILHVAGPGECLGEMALLDEEPRSASAMALEPLEVLMLSREAFDAVVAQQPAVAQAVISELVRRVRRLNERVQDGCWLDVPGRIAKTQMTPHGIRITVPLSRDDLAQLVGAARPTVSKELCGFRDQGLLTIDREGITLRQIERLRHRIC